eukprot:1131625-Pleurochrysis_carterae.AAC.2
MHARTFAAVTLASTFCMPTFRVFSRHVAIEPQAVRYMRERRLSKGLQKRIREFYEVRVSTSEGGGGALTHCSGTHEHEVFIANRLATRQTFQTDMSAQLREGFGCEARPEKTPRGSNARRLPRMRNAYARRTRESGRS